MKDPVVRETLRQIQDIVRQETGQALHAGATSRVEKVLASAVGRLGMAERKAHNQARDVTILLADLRGFTSISATYPAGTVVELLNRCFVRMSEIIFRHHGTIDKFMGDSILVLFDAGTGRDPVRRALACAVDMQTSMDEANRAHRAEGVPEMFFGIGINTGQVMSALLGSDLYSEYTVIGDEVNLASRIESFSLRGQVLISQSTFERCAGFVATGDPMDVFVKGKSKPVVLREVLAIPSLGKQVPRQEIRRSPRVEVKLPFVYQRIENEVIVPEMRDGRILDIGYHGVLAEVEDTMESFTELKMEMDLPLVGVQCADLYGKVVKVIPKDGRTRIGIEFSSMSAQTKANIQLFVQLLIQGTESRE